MNFNGLGAADSHRHAFSPERETQPFERMNLVNTVLYRLVVAELSRVLGRRDRLDVLVYTGYPAIVEQWGLDEIWGNGAAEAILGGNAN